MNGFLVCSLISLIIYALQYDWTFIFLYFLVFMGYIGLTTLFVPSHSKKFNNIRRKLAIATWSDPDSPECTGHGSILISNALSFISSYNAQTNQNLTLSQLFCKAAADSYSEYPDMRGHLAFGCFVPEFTSSIHLVTPLQQGHNLSHTLLNSCNEKSLKQIVECCNQNASPVYVEDSVNIPKRLGQLLMYLPSAASGVLLDTVAYVAGCVGFDVEWLGVKKFPIGRIVVVDGEGFVNDIVYPTLVPALRAPIVLVLSSVKEVPLVENGKIVVRKVVHTMFTGDHRYGDGTRVLKAMQATKKRMENPEEFYKIE